MEKKVQIGSEREGNLSDSPDPNLSRTAKIALTEFHEKLTQVLQHSIGATPMRSDYLEAAAHTLKRLYFGVLNMQGDFPVERELLERTFFYSKDPIIQNEAFNIAQCHEYKYIPEARVQ